MWGRVQTHGERWDRRRNVVTWGRTSPALGTWEGSGTRVEGDQPRGSGNRKERKEGQRFGITRTVSPPRTTDP